MMLERITNILGWFTDPLAHLLNQIAGFFLLATMVLTGLDVGMRYFMNNPISGSFEMVQYMMPMMVTFGMAQCALKERHVQVDMVTSLLPDWIQRLLKSLTHLFMCIMFLLIAWQSFVKGTDMYSSGQYTEVLYMPIYPFVYAVALSCAALSLVSLKMFFQFLAEIKK